MATYLTQCLASTLSSVQLVLLVSILGAVSIWLYRYVPSANAVHTELVKC